MIQHDIPRLQSQAFPWYIIRRSSSITFSNVPTLDKVIFLMNICISIENSYQSRGYRFSSFNEVNARDPNHQNILYMKEKIQKYYISLIDHWIMTSGCCSHILTTENPDPDFGETLSSMLKYLIPFISWRQYLQQEDPYYHNGFVLLVLFIHLKDFKFN